MIWRMARRTVAAAIVGGNCIMDATSEAIWAEATIQSTALLPVLRLMALRDMEAKIWAENKSSGGVPVLGMPQRTVKDQVATRKRVLFHVITLVPDHERRKGSAKIGFRT
jgi:hypothetical protein